MIAGLIRGHPLGVFFIVCLLLVIVETGLLLTALIVNTIVKYCQLERHPAVQLRTLDLFSCRLVGTCRCALKDPEVVSVHRKCRGEKRMREPKCRWPRQFR